MHLNELSDGQLLAAYRCEAREGAFAELVRRHLSLVLGAARRLVGGDSGTAEDVAQSVFTELARQAARLERHPSLAGWLYTTTRHMAGHARRERERREKREHLTMTPTPPLHDAPGDWEPLRPMIDDAMAELPEEDRHAVLLRFFEGREWKEVGDALGLTDNAARMRIQRALEKLRVHLRRKGVTTSASALAALLTANAAPTAPAALISQIASASIVASAAAPTLTSLVLSMKTPLIYSVSAVLLAIPIIHQELGIQRTAAELANLSAELQAGSNRSLSGPLSTQEELEQLRREATELESLRSEAERLRTSIGSDRRAQIESAELKLRAAESDLQSAVATKEAKRVREQSVDSLKHLGLAARIFATDNQERFPTSFGEMREIIGLDGDKLPSGLPIDGFEFYPQPRVISEREPQLFLFREKEPRLAPDGTWERAYTLADGSVQNAHSSTKDFSEWERTHQGIASKEPPRLAP